MHRHDSIYTDSFLQKVLCANMFATLLCLLYVVRQHVSFIAMFPTLLCFLRCYVCYVAMFAMLLCLLCSAPTCLLWVWLTISTARMETISTARMERKETHVGSYEVTTAMAVIAICKKCALCQTFMELVHDQTHFLNLHPLCTWKSILVAAPQHHLSGSFVVVVLLLLLLLLLMLCTPTPRK